MKSLMLSLIVCVLTQASAIAQNIESDLNDAVTNLNSAIDQLNTNDPQSKSTLQQSAAKIEQIIDTYGVQSPGMYHALGNAYMLQGDTGHAVLAYRRGEILDPTNKELHHSLNFARSSVSTQIDPSVSNKFWNLILIWRGSVSRYHLTILFVVLFTTGWITLAGRAIRLLPKAFFHFGFVLILVSIFPLFMLGSDWYYTHSANAAIITQSETIARTGPDDSVYALVYEEPLAPGLEIRLIESRDGWSHAKLMDGSQCWIRNTDFEYISQ